MVECIAGFLLMPNYCLHIVCIYIYVFLSLRVMSSIVGQHKLGVLLEIWV